MGVYLFMSFKKVNIFLIFIIFPVYVSGFNIESVNNLAGNIPPLSCQNLSEYSPEIIEYFKYYDMNVVDAEHYFGYFFSSNLKIAAHIYQPENPVGTIVFFHGYLDHSGLYMGIIRYFLEKKFNIAIYDLPGHGLSEGKRSDIEDFSDYVLVVNNFLNIISNNLIMPFYAIGHSTGSAALIEYFYNYENIFDISFLASPLIHTYMWDISLLGMNIMELFSENIFRRYGGASTNKEYLDFVKNSDPFQSKSVPFHWARVHRLWEKDISNYKINSSKIVVLQGLDDTVVDYKYNIEFLKERFPNISINFFKDARHSLFNEKTEIQQAVFKTIFENIYNSETLR